MSSSQADFGNSPLTTVMPNIMGPSYCTRLTNAATPREMKIFRVLWSPPVVKSLWVVTKKEARSVTRNA